MNPIETTLYIKLDTIASTVVRQTVRNSNWRLRKVRIWMVDKCKFGNDLYIHAYIFFLRVIIIIIFIIIVIIIYEKQIRNEIDMIMFGEKPRGEGYRAVPLMWGIVRCASDKTVPAASGLPVSAGAACRDQFPREHACPRR